MFNILMYHIICNALHISGYVATLTRGDDERNMITWTDDAYNSEHGPHKARVIKKLKTFGPQQTT